MGNCINRSVTSLPANLSATVPAPPPANPMSEYASPGSMPDTAPGVFTEQYRSNQQAWAQSTQSAPSSPSTPVPRKERSDVSRFLDIYSHRYPSLNPNYSSASGSSVGSPNR